MGCSPHVAAFPITEMISRLAPAKTISQRIANLRPMVPAISRFTLVLLAGLLVSKPSPAAPAEPSKEYQIKAVLLLNLARFVDWPPSAFATPDSPLVIGVVG